MDKIRLLKCFNCADMDKIKLLNCLRFTDVDKIRYLTVEIARIWII
jgi:hypothetical protein